jgi:hypothetical protein
MSVNYCGPRNETQICRNKNKSSSQQNQSPAQQNPNDSKRKPNEVFGRKRQDINTLGHMRVATSLPIVFLRGARRGRCLGPAREIGMAWISDIRNKLF